MLPSPFQRQGRSSVLLLVGLLLALCLGLALWLWMAHGAERQTAVGVVLPQAEQQEAQLHAPGSPEGGRDDVSGARLVLGELDVPVGVRLGGPGLLVGQVLERGSGAGVAGARVDLLPFPPAASDLISRILRLGKSTPSVGARVLPIATAASDADGNFRFEGVRAGRYFLDARSTWHACDQVEQVEVLASGAGGPTTVWVRGAGRIFGVVMRPDGRPMGAVDLDLGPSLGSLLEGARRGELRHFETSSDEQGRFAFVGVPAGPKYEIMAHARGYANSYLLEVEVEAGQDRQVLVQLRRGGRVEGRLLSAPGPGEPAQSAAVPLAGAHLGVIARGLRDLYYAEEVLRATYCQTGPDGRFAMNDVPPGEFDIIAIASEHVAARLGPLQVASEATLEAPDLSLLRGPMLSGIVVDGAGEPIDGVGVRWDVVDFDSLQFDVSFAPFLAQAVEGFDFPRTGSDGRFVAGALAGEPPYRVQFYKEGYANESASWSPGESEELRVVLHGGGAIEGIVLDKLKGVPIPRFSIRGAGRIDEEPSAPGALNPFSGVQLVEDPGGRFKVPAVSAGTRSLTISAPGYQDKELTDLTVVEGQTLKGVVAQLEPGATLRGKVFDSTGAVVAGARVMATDDSGRPLGLRLGEGVGEFFSDEAPPGAAAITSSLGLLGDRAVLSKPDGSFELRGVPPGRLRLAGSHRDFALTRGEPIEVRAAQSVEDLRLTLDTGGGLYGRVTDRFDRPLAGAIVLAVSPGFLPQGGRGQGDVYQGETDAEGNYRIEHMRGGGYFVVLTRGDQTLSPMSFLGASQFELVSVPSNENTRWDLVDRSAAACRVFGRVTALGEPVDGGVVFALGFESENTLGVDIKIAQVRKDGSYQFEGLAPGNYQFRFQGQGPDVKLSIEVPDLPEYELELALPEGALEGRVVDALTGQPIEQAELSLSPEDQMVPEGLLGTLLSQSNLAARAYSDEQGNFRFEALQAGEYRLTARGPRWGERAGEYAPAEPLAIALNEGELRGKLELRLQPSLRIAGLVRDELGVPLEGVSILAFADGRADLAPERAKTGPEGRFTLRGLAAQSYTLELRRDGYAAGRVAGLRAEPQPEERELVLERGVLVNLIVSDASGQPLQGAAGRLIALDQEQMARPDAELSLNGWFNGKSLTNVEGRQELGRYHPGRYRLEVRRGLKQTSETVEIAQQEESELRVRLE